MSIRESMTRSMREHELAGDARAGTFARDKAWRAQVVFMRERWRWLAAGWLLLVSPVAAVWWFVPSFVQGLVLGAALTAATLLLWSLVVQSTGTAPTMMGDQAEQWTAQELRRLRRSGWRVVNGLSFSDGDVDHVLVGPGGIVVFETKWSARSWTDCEMAERIRGARQQAERGSRRMGLWLRDSRLPVRPVVVLWGGGLRRSGRVELPLAAGGCDVVAGHRLRDYLGSLEHGEVAPSARVDAVLAKLDQHARQRDEYDLSRQAPLLMPHQWVLRIMCLVVGVVAGSLAVAFLADLGAWWSAAGGVVASLLGVVGHRRAGRVVHLRVAADGLVIGAGLSTVALVVAKVVLRVG